MTQRDALESKLELIETKKQQMNAMVNIYYEALGGRMEVGFCNNCCKMTILLICVAGVNTIL